MHLERMASSHVEQAEETTHTLFILKALFSHACAALSCRASVFHRFEVRSSSIKHYDYFCFEWDRGLDLGSVRVRYAFDSIPPPPHACERAERVWETRLRRRLRNEDESFGAFASQHSPGRASRWCLERRSSTLANLFSSLLCVSSSASGTTSRRPAMSLSAAPCSRRWRRTSPCCPCTRGRCWARWRRWTDPPTPTVTPLLTTHERQTVDRRARVPRDSSRTAPQGTRKHTNALDVIGRFFLFLFFLGCLFLYICFFGGFIS